MIGIGDSLTGTGIKCVTGTGCGDTEVAFVADIVCSNSIFTISVCFLHIGYGPDGFEFHLHAVFGSRGKIDFCLGIDDGTRGEGSAAAGSAIDGAARDALQAPALEAAPAGEVVGIGSATIFISGTHLEGVGDGLVWAAAGGVGRCAAVGALQGLVIDKGVLVLAAYIYLGAFLIIPMCRGDIVGARGGIVGAAGRLHGR